MADITTTQMGLIIGFVLGPLFLALLGVVAYTLLDRDDEKPQPPVAATAPPADVPNGNTVTWVVTNTLATLGNTEPIINPMHAVPEPTWQPLSSGASGLPHPRAQPSGCLPTLFGNNRTRRSEPGSLRSILLPCVGGTADANTSWSTAQAHAHASESTPFMLRQPQASQHIVAHYGIVSMESSLPVVRAEVSPSTVAMRLSAAAEGAREGSMSLGSGAEGAAPEVALTLGPLARTSNSSGDGWGASDGTRCMPGGMTAIHRPALRRLADVVSAGGYGGARGSSRKGSGRLG